MHQDAEQFADRVTHLEKKEAEAKKLQRVGKKESKRVEKVRKARKQLTNPAGCPEPLHPRQAQQKAYKKQNKQRKLRLSELKKEEKETRQARDAHRLIASPLQNSPLLMFMYLVKSSSAIETVYLRKQDHVSAVPNVGKDQSNIDPLQ